MARTKKRDVNAWANELALTGQFKNWRGVELHMRTHGQPGAKLSDPFWKREVDRICAVQRGAVDA